MTKKQTQQLLSIASSQGGLAAKAMAFPLIPVTMIMLQILIFWLSTKVSLFPGSDAFFSIVSSCAQIVAGLYGITLAGYTFFLSRIDALSASDATLDYVVASIKKRFTYLIWYITSNVLMTLFISIILMYSPVPSDERLSFFYRLFCNEFILFVAFSILLILYYSLLVVDPNCIQREARNLKRKLGVRFGPQGNVVEFISLYDRIEEVCSRMLPAPVLHQLHENKGKHFELTLELIQEQRLVPKPLISDLIRIHRYYECMVNCSPMSASLEMCLLAERTLRQLEHTESR